MNAVLFSNIKQPSLNVIEDVTASRTLQLASFTNIYLFGVSGTELNSLEFNLVSSHKGWVENYGLSTTDEQILIDDIVRLIFLNDPRANLYFFNLADNSLSSYMDAFSKVGVEDNYEPGILLAPGAIDKVGVYNGLIAKAEELDFAVFASLTEAPLNVVATERENYTASPKGYLSTFYPPLIESFSGEDRSIPPAPIAAAIATKRWKEEGYKPAAGIKYPLKGIREPKLKFTTQELGVLSDAAINPIRKIRNAGTVIWDMRTTSELLLYKFTHHRVITSVVNHTFRRSLELKLALFDLIDGQGNLLAFLEDGSDSVGRQLYQSKLLYGAVEAEAFASKCDLENNPPEQLQQGNVLVEFTFAVAPGLRNILVVTRQSEIGRVVATSQQGASDADNAQTQL